MKTGKEWSPQSYLEGLRPDPGWIVETALLATYSADVTSIAAALLSMAERDDDRGSGSQADLAEAVTDLRGKVRIVLQQGRLSSANKRSDVTAIFDQFLIEVPFDQNTHSWHPKMAFVRFSNQQGEVRWRLWLGSRNLTVAANRDLGLLLTGGVAIQGGVRIDGLVDVFDKLASSAQLAESDRIRLVRELKDVTWNVPAGLKIKRIRLTGGQGNDPLPVAPEGVTEVAIVSPFLHGVFLKTIGTWGGGQTPRTLFSTQTELLRLAAQPGKPLEAFASNLLSFQKPMNDWTEEDEDETGDEVEIGAEEAPILGLHAKILAARTARKVFLWIGSPNATTRAWEGRNVEIIAEIEADLGYWEGLKDLLGRGLPCPLEQLVKEGFIEDQVRKRLEEARNSVAWSCRTATLLRDGDTFRLEVDHAPHPLDHEIALHVGMATGSLVPWMQASTMLELGTFPLALQTELVQLRLSLEGSECCWMQRFPVTPPLDANRDRAALARYLGPKAFLAWWRSLIDGGSVEGEAPAWDAPVNSQQATGSLNKDLDSLTIESMLACWARDPAAFERANMRVQDYLDLILDGSYTEQQHEMERLQELRSIWNTLTTELLEK